MCLESVIAPLVLVLLLLTLPNVVLIHHLLPSSIIAVRPRPITPLPITPLLPGAAFPFLRTVAAVVEFLQGFSNVRARVYAHAGSAGTSMLS